MSFSKSPIILSVPANRIADVAQARETYGEFLPLRPLEAGGEVVKTLLGHLDREGSDDLRAGVLGVTVAGTQLTDGSVAFFGYIATRFLSAIGTDSLLDGVKILTEEEYISLLPKP